VLIYAASTTLPPLAARAAAPTLELILTRQRVSSPNVPLDGRFVAHVVRVTGTAGNGWVTQLRVADGATRRTPGTGASRAGRTIGTVEPTAPLVPIRPG
jgi:hypothetical protein